MRGMRKWKRWAVFLLLFVVLAVGGSRTAQAEMLNMTDFQDNNGTITVTKVPRGKAGNKISIKMTIHNTAEKGDNSFKTIRVTLKYGADKNEKIISGIKRISKPGLRVYAGKDEIPQVLGGLGIAILSTNQGIVTDKQARKLQVGGEVLAFVW